MRCMQSTRQAEFSRKWLGKLTKLNPATGSGKCRGKAPHKPLLLLCLLDNQNDDIENGLALCKNAHWMFDEGLWSVRADGRVMLAPQRFTENGPEGLRLQPYAGRLLQFAAGVTLRPKTDYFTRHRLFHAMIE